MTLEKLSFWFRIKEFFNNYKSSKLIIVIIIIFGLWFFMLREPITYPFLMDPQMEEGDEFFVKTPDGRYITACGDCLPKVTLDNRCSHYLCAKRYPYQTSVFTYRKHDDRRFSIETAFGKYWKRCSGCVEFCHDVICADGENKKLRTSKFELIKNRNGTVSFRNDMGRMLELCPCGDEGDCGKLMCSLGVFQKNTEFIIEKIPDRFPDPVLQFIKFKPDFVKKQDPRFLGVLLSNLA